MRFTINFLIIFSLILVMPSVSLSGIIFEDDFSDTGVGWTASNTNGSYATDVNLKNWSFYKAPSTSTASLGTVSGGLNGTPMMRIGYQWGGGASQAMVLGKHLTGDKNKGYNELYIRYTVKLDTAFRAGDGTQNYWKWFRLFQDITPGNINNEGENDAPQDTRFIVATASNNPPKWGGMFNTNRNNASVDGQSYKIYFNPENCETTSSGCFEAIPGWRFNNSTGILDNPTPQNWHTLEWHIKLSDNDCNTSGTGSENGIFEMWIDGVKQTSSLKYSQKNGETKICSAIPTMQYQGGINWINVFDNMGGWSDTWISARYVYLDNVVISDSYIGPNYVVSDGGAPLPPQDSMPPAPPPSLW